MLLIKYFINDLSDCWTNDKKRVIWKYFLSFQFRRDKDFHTNILMKKNDLRHEKRALIFRQHNSQKTISKFTNLKRQNRGNVSPEVILSAAHGKRYVVFTGYQHEKLASCYMRGGHYRFSGENLILICSNTNLKHKFVFEQFRMLWIAQ